MAISNRLRGALSRTSISCGRGAGHVCLAERRGPGARSPAPTIGHSRCARVSPKGNDQGVGSPEPPPDGDYVDEDLIGVEPFEFDDRQFVIARIAPHPTAIRAVFEVPDEGEPEHKSGPELVAESSDPYFWVEQYGSILDEYLREVRLRLESIMGDEDLDDDDDGPVDQVFEPSSAVGKAARQSAVGVRALSATLAEVLVHASSEAGWPEDPIECAHLVSLFVDATMAAGVLEQLGGQPAIPEDVVGAWDPTNPST